MGDYYLILNTEELKEDYNYKIEVKKGKYKHDLEKIEKDLKTFSK